MPRREERLIDLAVAMRPDVEIDSADQENRERNHQPFEACAGRRIRRTLRIVHLFCLPATSAATFHAILFSGLGYAAVTRSELLYSCRGEFARSIYSAARSRARSARAPGGAWAHPRR